MHDTTIWKNQRWFKKLSKDYKLAFLYIKDNCDHAGLWKVDHGELVDDVGLEEFNLNDFIKCCNRDFEKITGKQIERERVKLLENKTVLWITGFIKFQYESKEFIITPNVPVVRSALELLSGHKTLGEALQKGYITLPEAYSKATERAKDKDKDKDKDIINLLYYSSDSKEGSRRLNNFKEVAKPILIHGKNHEPKKNGNGYVYPTIIGTEFNKEKTKVKLIDNTWQTLSDTQHNHAKAGVLKPEQIWKGKIK